MPEDFFSFGKAKEVDVNKIMRQSGFESTYRVLPPSTPDSPKITDLCYSIACKFDSEFNVLPPYDAITGCVKVSFIGKHIALAMYQTAKPQNKKAVGSLMLAGAVAAFFTGVTEPLEFSFMFLCPQLYLLHAVLTGISMFIAAAFHWTASFGFSAGLVDFILSSRLPLANQPYMLLLEGVVMAVVYYVSFRFLITRFNLKTPGREDDDAATEPAAGAAATEPAVAQPAPAQAKSGDYAQMAEQIYAALGGAQNVVSIDNCATRLRVEVRDSSAVDAAACKRAGAVAVVKPAKDAVQVVIGPKVQFVADAVKAIAK